MSEQTFLLGGNENQLTKSQKFLYSLGHIQNDITAAIWFTYSLLYFRLVAELPPLYSGFLMFAGQFVDGVATPIAGYFVDNAASKKTLYFTGSLLTTISFPCLYVLCNICNDDKILILFYYLTGIALFQIGWALVQISHLAILPELTNSPNQRSQLTSSRYAASMVSNIVVYLIAWMFFRSNNSSSIVNSSDSDKFKYMVLLNVLVGVLTSVIFICFIKMHNGLNKELIITTINKTSFVYKVKKICNSLEIYKIAALYTASRLFMTISMEYIPLFINENISDKEALATVPLVLFISSATNSIIFNFFNSGAGSNKVSYSLGCVVSLIGCFLVYTMNENTSGNIRKLYTATVLFGIGSSLTIVSSLALVANLIGNKIDFGGFAYSAVTFSDKLFNGIVVIIIEYIKCNEDRNVSCLTYNDVLSYVNGCIIIIGFSILVVTPAKLFIINKYT